MPLESRAERYPNVIPCSVHLDNPAEVQRLYDRQPDGRYKLARVPRQPGALVEYCAEITAGYVVLIDDEGEPACR